MALFNRRSMLWLAVLGVAVSAVIARYAFRPEPGATVATQTNPIRETGPDIRSISTRAEWDSATDGHRCVVFVDCAWNVEVARFRQPFSKYAAWCRANTDASVLTIRIDSGDMTNDVWKICDQLWTTNQIDPGGLKNYGGAGRVLWIDNGRVADYAWCMELTNPDDFGDTKMLMTRTRKAFDR